jgi:hypothetical protein
LLWFKGSSFLFGSLHLSFISNGDVLAATNIGSGTMTVDIDATGAVTVTRNGNGNVFVATTPANNLRASLEQNVVVTCLHSKDVSPTVNGGGSINVVNNGAQSLPPPSLELVASPS